MTVSNGNDGVVEVLADSGHAPYSYQWTGPNSFYSTSSGISSLYAETYSVTVTDTNNCSVNTSINLTEPAALIFTTLSSTDVLASAYDTVVLLSHSSFFLSALIFCSSILLYIDT